MAEVIGAVSAVFTLLEGCIAIGKTIRHMKHASTELCELNNEVADLQLLLYQLQQLVDEDLTLETFMASSMQHTQMLLSELKAFVDGLRKKRFTARLEWLAEREKARSYVSDMKQARLRLASDLMVGSK